MDLPPCPSCGSKLELDANRGPARCSACGFVGPVEVDRKALDHLLDDASARGLGPRTMLAASTEAPEPRLEGRATPSMLDGPKAPELPQLSPPPVPRELREGAPPEMEDPRAATLPRTGEEAARTRLDDDLEDRRDARERDLRARGELLR